MQSVQVDEKQNIITRIRLIREKYIIPVLQTHSPTLIRYIILNQQIGINDKLLLERNKLYVMKKLKELKMQLNQNLINISASILTAFKLNLYKVSESRELEMVDEESPKHDGFVMAGEESPKHDGFVMAGKESPKHDGFVMAGEKSPNSKADEFDDDILKQSDNQVAELLYIYLKLYLQIEELEKKGFTQHNICLSLKKFYPEINCDEEPRPPGGFWQAFKDISAMFFDRSLLKDGSNWKYKYLKYKKKYLTFKNQKGGAPLEIMPQLCFGTAQNNLENALQKALKIGYRHIDGAENYGNSDYKNIIKRCIKVIPRNELWITWKSDDISLDNINRICTELDCEYIDLFLFHHSCGNEKGYSELKNAQTASKIRYYGVSNCEDLETIKQLKTDHNIFANQIQARPPKGKVKQRKRFNPPNFIEECNKIGVNIMLFSTIGGILMSEDYSLIMKHISNVNKYYIQKYIIRTNNVLMVSSVSLTSTLLQKNFEDINNILCENQLLTGEQMIEIEYFLTLTILHNM